jgi:predicted alpha-1,2-mannosidase
MFLDAMLRPLKIIFLAVLIIGLACSRSGSDPILLVDPFIGTGGHGHTFPGATAPFGMVQLSPDTRLEGWDGCSGYHYSDSIVFGFSHTHLSGTGVADYCDILFKPCIGPLHWDNGYKGEPGYGSKFSKESEQASPGFYSVILEEGIQVDLTAGPRSGFHKYLFDKMDEAHVVLDLLHRDPLLEGRIEMINDSTIAGFRRSSSWARDQIVYFYAIFDQPWSSMQAWKSEGFTDEWVKAAFFFEPQEEKTIMLKVGISAVDINGARKNLEADIQGWDFEGRKEVTEQLWRDELKKIEIEAEDSVKEIFYTALYHSMIAPNLFSDVDGRYRKSIPKTAETPYDAIGQLDEGEAQFTIFSLWDTYRATHPLYSIIDRKRSLQYIHTFLRQYEDGGQLPVWELACNYTGCMIGYHSVSVIADAFAKGITDFDTELALEAMRHSAEQEHMGLRPFRSRGYISSEDEAESVSKTLEYAYDDWCIAEFAEQIGELEVYADYSERAQFYKNLYDPEDKFIKARYNGGWYKPFKPEEVNFNYTEANGWQYSLAVPHDIAGLINLMGGQAVLEAHLDSLFTSDPQLSGRKQSDITGLIGQYAHGNEPSHHMAYLYNFTSSPWKTQYYTSKIAREMYSTHPDGLSGNEDCGQMSSWYVLSAIGIYDVCPGSPYYELSGPVVERAVIRLENGNEFDIRRKGSGPFIQSIQLNGANLEGTSLSHDVIMKGGNLVYFMGEEANEAWGLAEKAYSSIDDAMIVPVPAISAASPSFQDSMLISIYAIEGEVMYKDEIRDTNFLSYSGPFYIYEDSKVEAYAIKNELKSKVVRSSYKKVNRNWILELHSGYASQYAASGDNALIDGIGGGMDFRTGAWQGYQASDLDLTIDLKEMKRIRSVRVSCLQDVNSWIWLPKEVEIILKDARGNLVGRERITHDVPDNLYGSIPHEFIIEGDFRNVQFIEIRAINYGLCPEWHLGAGGQAWIFADEVIIE